MCQIHGDVQQLEAYLDKFAATTFAEFVVRHFIERRKLNFILRAQLLRRADIARCLDKYPFLSWIKTIVGQLDVRVAHAPIPLYHLTSRICVLLVRTRSMSLTPVCTRSCVSKCLARSPLSLLFFVVVAALRL